MIGSAKSDSFYYSSYLLLYYYWSSSYYDCLWIFAIGFELRLNDSVNNDCIFICFFIKVLF